MPELKKRCSKCNEEIPEGEKRRIEKKKGKDEVFCRRCFRKRLGAKDEEETTR